MSADKTEAAIDTKASGDNNAATGGDGGKNGANKSEDGPMALGEIAFIDSKITSTKLDVLQPLYNICFDAAGKAQTLKKNLRTFRGFSFAEDSADYKKKLESVQKLDVKVLKAICDILDVDKKGANKDIAERICKFLLSPEGEPEPEDDGEEEEEEEEDEEEEEEAPKPKKGNAAAGKRGSTTGRPQRSTAGKSFNHEDFLTSEDEEEEDPKPKGKRKRGDTDSGSDYNPSGGGSDSDTGRKARASGTRRSARYQSNSEDEDDDDFGTSDEESDPPARNKRGAAPARRPPARGGRKKQVSESEESEPEESDDSDAPKKKKKAAPVAKKGKASPAKGRGRPKRVAATKKKTRDQTTSEEDDDEEEEEVDDEMKHLQDEVSEDEPLAKKPKSGAAFPSDDDIKGYVKKILDEANLEEITMKTVCKEVYAQFPGHDLTHKKEFIKDTVKSLIAT